MNFSSIRLEWTQFLLAFFYFLLLFIFSTLHSTQDAAIKIFILSSISQCIYIFEVYNKNSFILGLVGWLHVFSNISRQEMAANTFVLRLATMSWEISTH